MRERERENYHFLGICLGEVSCDTEFQGHAFKTLSESLSRMSANVKKKGNQHWLAPLRANSLINLSIHSVSFWNERRRTDDRTSLKKRGEMKKRTSLGVSSPSAGMARRMSLDKANASATAAAAGAGSSGWVPPPASDRTHRPHRIRGVILIDKASARPPTSSASSARDVPPQLVVESASWCLLPKQKLRFEADDIVSISDDSHAGTSQGFPGQPKCSFSAPPPCVTNAIKLSASIRDICSDVVVNAKNSCVLCVSAASTRPLVCNTAQSVVMQIFDLIADRSGPGTGEPLATETWSVSASIVAISDNSQWRDMLAASNTNGWARTILSNNPMTGPFIVGSSSQRLRTASSFNSLYSAAVSTLVASAASDAKAKGALVATQLVLRRVKAVANEPPESAQVYLSSMLMVDVGERYPLLTRIAEGLSAPNPSTLTGITELLHLLNGISTGNIASCVTVAAVADDDESNFVSNCLSAQQKLMQMNLHKPPANAGRVNEATAEAEASVAELEEQLKAPSVDSGQRRRLERQLAERRATARTLRGILSAACGVRMKVVDKAKCDKFAEVFRMAYLVRTQRALDPNFKLADLDGPARGRHREDLEKLASQLHSEQSLAKVVRGERDRAVYHATTLQRELREEKSKNYELMELNKKLKQAAHDAHLRADLVEKDLSEAKLQLADGNTRRHIRITELEEAAAAHVVHSTTQQEAYQRLQSDVARLTHEAGEEAARERELLRKRLAGVEAELAASRAAHAAALEMHENEKRDGDVLREERACLTQELASLRKKVADAEDIFSAKAARLSELHGIECEAYLGFIAEGHALVEEFRAMDLMTLGPTSSSVGSPTTTSLYRGGPQEVAAWLGALGLGSYTSAFAGSGFESTHLCSLLTERDLEAMQITPGMRRKILAASADLAAKYSEVFRRSTSLFGRKERDVQVMSPSHDRCVSDEAKEHFGKAATLADLVSDLEAWLVDFAETIRANTAIQAGPPAETRDA
jgi:hypothetical protein